MSGERIHRYKKTDHLSEVVGLVMLGRLCVAIFQLLGTLNYEMETHSGS